MTPDAGPPVTVWEELERRRVLRVAVAYVVAAFAVLQLVRLLLGMGAAPEQLFRVVLGAVTLGFPAAIVLAWTYDVTPEGIMKTPEDAVEDPEYDAGPAKRWAIFVAISALVGIVLSVLQRG